MNSLTRLNPAISRLHSPYHYRIHPPGTQQSAISPLSTIVPSESINNPIPFLAILVNYCNAMNKYLLSAVLIETDRASLEIMYKNN